MPFRSGAKTSHHRSASLLCATTQHSYVTRASAVRPPAPQSVRKTHFLSNREANWCQIWGEIPLHSISKYFFCFTKILNLRFFPVFINMGVSGSKNLGEYPSDSLPTPNKKIMHSPNEGLYKVFQKIVNFKFYFFIYLFFFFAFSLTWDHMGVKVSNNISDERRHQIRSPLCVHPREGFNQRC